jgi:hypothetical protein
MSLTAPERETIVSLNDEDDTAHIWTAQRPYITKLKRNAAATLLDEGEHDGSAWATFELPADLVSFRSKKKDGRKLSVEQRAEVAVRFAKARSHRRPNVVARLEI